MATHRCPAPGCTAQLPPHLFACPQDWRLLPWRLRQPIVRAYRGGAGIGTPELSAAHSAALNWYDTLTIDD